ncbi:GNAT family N-acetyltransferase [Helicovermis profundi]|uniref:GNAT family N-acetyltransferase n=1 Tax=Helicovermis profundi TaxID=3065157 RepID=A0AAU9EAU5_9FIRM|nr:GNAT family N-acetyltransferase [Clostridia bacterium S502]
MSRLKLILPSLEYKDQIMAYKKEFIEAGDSMDGTAGLANYDTFEKWYSAILDNLNEDTVREGLVPASTYLALIGDSDRLVGMIDIRHRLNDYLLKCGGHIGYSVRKSERKKGFATEMLNLALKECTKLKIKKVLVTCDKNNIASVKTIINNGGVFENLIECSDGSTNRYWITL